MFSLTSVMPSKRAAAWALIAVVLAVFLAWPIKGYIDRQQEKEAVERFHADEMWSSGKLSLAHTALRSEEHTSELQSLMRISYAVFCLKKTKEKHTRQKKERSQ